MAYWKMGVAAFMPNNSFKFGNRIGAVTASAITTGTSFTYSTETINGETGTDSLHLTKFLRPGDKVLLGPSTATNYEGASEYVKVTSASSSTIAFAAQTTFQYASGDPVTGIGTNCARDWLPSNSTDIVMGGLFDHTQRSLSTTDGNFDRFSLQFKNLKTGTRYIYSDLNLDDFLSDSYFRIGCYYQYLGVPTDDGSCNIQLRSNSSNFIDSVITSVNVSTAWTEHNSSSALSTVSHNNEFQVRLVITSSAGYGILNVDNIYVEHAASTDGDGAAVYTFVEYPDLNSRSFSTLRGTSYKRLHNYSIKPSDATGDEDASKKYIISAKYTDVPRSLRDNLDVFMSWQNRGKKLVLHHDIQKVPPNVQGYLSIRDTRLTSWDSGLCSFSMTFEEA